MSAISFKCIQTEHDRQVARELFASCFAANNSYFSHYQSVEMQLKFSPALKPENYWLVLTDDQIIGATQIYTFPIRFGVAVLEMGGIGGVCTLPAFRKQGFNEALLNHCLIQMKKMNLDLSLLGGIPNYYHRYGYAVVMPNYQLTLSSRKLFELRQTHTIRKFTPVDLPELNRLFAREYSALSGTHIRSDEFWQYHFKSNPVIYVAENSENQIVGYVWLDTRQQIRIREAAIADNDVAESLLRFLAGEAQPRFQPEITGNLHPEQPFVRALKSKCDVSITTRYQRNGGWMGRLIHLESTFQKLAPELGKCLQSGSHGMNLNVGFRTEIGDVVLALKAGQVRVVKNEPPTQGFLEISQSVLTRLIFGYCDFTELANLYRLTVPKAYQSAIPVLFPARHAFISEPDHF